MENRRAACGRDTVVSFRVFPKIQAKHPGWRFTPMRIQHLFQQTEEQEPLGIVIADGGRGDALPRFSAFVWGPVPEDSDLIDEPEPLAVAAAV